MSTLCYKGLKLSQGNSKLKKTDKVDFLIWNIIPIVTCPYSTPNCRKKCYAMKAYRLYPSVKRVYDSNYNLSMQVTFVPNMIAFISGALNKLKKGKTVYFRIHEAGDFYSLEYLHKWNLITKHFSGDDRIIFQAYTKSVRYIDLLIAVDNTQFNIHFTYSIWDDTSQYDIALAKSLRVQTFSASVKGNVNENEYECKCIDCGTCSACYKNLYDNIVIKIH
jgi:hypothetical protein